MTNNCPRQTDKCPMCGMKPGEDCPLDEPAPFQGPAIGATSSVGECAGGEVCEACQ